MEPETHGRKSTPQSKTSFQAVLRDLPRRLWQLLLRNLSWKLFAIFLAICLWAGLITQDPTLTRERVFTDVPVTLTGADILQRNGMIVLSSFDEEPLAVRMRVDVPQREYNSVTAANYSPRIDLSRITETGMQKLRIATTSATAYGIVKEVSPDSVDIMVDEYVPSYRIPVSIQRKGQFPNGYYGAESSLNPSAVTVSGPKSIVSQIARVMVDFDVSKLPAQTGLIRTAVPMRFTDAQGNSIESSLIDVTSAGVLLHTIVVEQTVYATKTLPINSLALTAGLPAAGYEVRGVSATPNILVGAGDEIGVGLLDSLFLEHPVDVTGKSESFTVDIKISKPPELVYLSTDSVTLYVEITPIINARAFENVKLTITDQGAKRNIACDIKSVSVTLTGPATILGAIKQSALTAYADVSELSGGTHEVPVLLKMEGVEEERKLTYAIAPKNVAVQIPPD